MNWINWLTTVGLLLAGAGWWFYGWYVKPRIARGAWEADRRDAKRKERAEQLKRQRTEENLIYDARLKPRFLDDRSGGKTANRAKLEELLRAQASLEEKVRKMKGYTNDSTNLS